MRPLVCILRTALAVALLFVPSVFGGADATLDEVLSYVYDSGLVASEKGDRFAWVENLRGVRNIWSAAAADSQPRQLTHYTADDGQELTQLTFSADGSQLLYVRGGDHDANWPAQGNLAPNPDNSPSEAKVTIWSISLADSASTPVQVAEGDSPALSSKGKLAYVKDGQIWTAPLPNASNVAANTQRLFFDRGKDNTPLWSQDGTRLAFISDRGDHSFVGVYTSSQPLLYLSPSTSFDSDPVWSPDGSSIAFMRQPSHGDGPENFLVQTPHPFAFWIADATTGKCRKVWNSPDTLAGSLPNLDEKEPLFWMADNQLVFLTETDNWPHLYAVDAAGGGAPLFAPGHFLVGNVGSPPGRHNLVYSANTGATTDDEDRRHLFRVGLDGRAPEPLTTGNSLEW